MQNTIFEKIIAREVPAEIVYEDDLVLAFFDIRPVNVGHTLVVPKKKFVNIFDAEPSTLGHMIIIAQKVARALREVTKCDGVNISMNNEPAAGQEVFHAHIHVVPRFTNDGAFLGVRHLGYDETLSKQVAASLSKLLT